MTDHTELSYITLQASNNQYLGAEDGGGGGCRADRNRPAEDEVFVLEELRYTGGPLRSYAPVALKTNKKSLYVSAIDGGGGSVAVDKTTVGTWEEFAIMKVQAPGKIASGAIHSGDKVAFRCGDKQNYYLSAEGGGGREIVANRTKVDAWETFVITLPRQVRVELQSLECEMPKDAHPLLGWFGAVEEDATYTESQLYSWVTQQSGERKSQIMKMQRADKRDFADEDRVVWTTAVPPNDSIGIEIFLWDKNLIGKDDMLGVTGEIIPLFNMPREHEVVRREIIMDTAGARTRYGPQWTYFVTYKITVTEVPRTGVGSHR